MFWGGLGCFGVVWGVSTGSGTPRPKTISARTPQPRRFGPFFNPDCSAHFSGTARPIFLFLGGGGGGGYIYLFYLCASKKRLKKHLLS